MWHLDLEVQSSGQYRQWIIILVYMLLRTPEIFPDDRCVSPMRFHMTLYVPNYTAHLEAAHSPPTWVLMDSPPWSCPQSTHLNPHGQPTAWDLCRRQRCTLWARTWRGLPGEPPCDGRTFCQAPAGSRSTGAWSTPPYPSWRAAAGLQITYHHLTTYKTALAFHIFVCFKNAFLF